MSRKPTHKKKRAYSPALQAYHKACRAESAVVTRLVLAAVKRLARGDYPPGSGHIVLTKLQRAALDELAESAARNAIRRGSCVFTYRGRKYYASLTSWGRVKVSLDLYASPFMVSSSGPVLGFGRGY